MTRTRLMIFLAIVLGTLGVLLLTAGGGGEEKKVGKASLAQPPQTAMPAPSPPATPADESASTSAHGHDHEGEPVDVNQPLTPSSDEQEDAFAQARSLATEAAARFARPSSDVPDTSWLANLEPLLSARYLDNFRYIDPQNIPFTRVTGPVTVHPTEAPPHVLTLVQVPTDAGPWAVEIETDEDGMHVMAMYPWEDR